MAAGLVGDGEEDEAAVLEAADHLLGEAEFGGVDEVVGGVDPHHVGGDLLQLGRGIVVARGIELVELVVGIRVLDPVVNPLGQPGVGGVAGRVVLLHLQRRAAGNDREVLGGAQALDRLLGILPALPGRVGGDRVHGHLAPHAIAAGDLHGVAGQRHQAVHVAGVGLGPDEALHAAHGGADDQAQVVDAEALGQQLVLGQDHIVVVVFGEPGVQPVRGLGRLPVADGVRDDDVPARHIEQPARGEQHAGELGPDEGLAGSACAVQDDHRIGDAPRRIARRLAEGAIVHPQLGQGLAGAEMEVADDVVALLDG